ncbi:MAG: hypothetical protein LBE31_03815 [Deltaproteobacteria bacterium]|nr:hypothetical protein [Deltaproteobacteria bacterium]
MRLLMLAAIVAVIELIWNALMPDLAGLKKLSYLEAFLLLVLARFLFGAPGPGGVFYGLRGHWHTLSHDKRRSFMEHRFGRWGCDASRHNDRRGHDAHHHNDRQDGSQTGSQTQHQDARQAASQEDHKHAVGDEGPDDSRDARRCRWHDRLRRPHRRHVGDYLGLTHPGRSPHNSPFFGPDSPKANPKESAASDDSDTPNGPGPDGEVNA